MNKRIWVLALVLVLAAALGMAFACTGGDDDDDNDDNDTDDDIGDDTEGDDTEGDDTEGDDTDDDTDDCTDNVAPVLLSTTYIVNGSPATPPVTIDPNDLFGIYYEYADDDCNLPGGEFWISQDGGAYESLGVLPEELGCSSAQSGLIYGFSLNNPIPEGEIHFDVYWTDICGAESNVMGADVTVAAK